MNRQNLLPLPDIKIHLPVSGFKFIDQVCQILSKDSKLKNLFSYKLIPINSEIRRLDLYPSEINYFTQHKGIFAQIISNPKMPEIKTYERITFLKDDIQEIIYQNFKNQITCKIEDKGTLDFILLCPEAKNWCIQLRDEPINKIRTKIKVSFRFLSEDQSYPEMNEVNKILKDLIDILTKEKEKYKYKIKFVPGTDKVVDVEIRAIKWTPDPPIYEIYVDEARKILNPILKAYNKEYKSKLRLFIQSKNAIEKSFRLPFTIEKIFKTFTGFANKSCLHPLDWERFYKFIRACHYHRWKKPDVLEQLLRNEGFTEEYARELTMIFDHSYEVLSTWIPQETISIKSPYIPIIYKIISSNRDFLELGLENFKAERSKKDEIYLTLEGWSSDKKIKDKFFKELEKKLPPYVKIKDKIKILTRVK